MPSCLQRHGSNGRNEEIIIDGYILAAMTNIVPVRLQLDMLRRRRRYNKKSVSFFVLTLYNIMQYKLCNSSIELFSCWGRGGSHFVCVLAVLLLLLCLSLIKVIIAESLRVSIEENLFWALRLHSPLHNTRSKRSMKKAACPPALT